MRSKTLLLIAAAVVAFLLVTNPVVAEAARTITGKDIKNGSVTTKDIKNGSLLQRDFRAGQLPTGARGPAGRTGATGRSGVLSVHQLGGPGPPSLGPVLYAVFSPFREVTLGAGEAFLGGGSVALATETGEAEVSVDICISGGGPLYLLSGDHPPVVDATTTLTAVPVGGYVELPAGVYSVGLCGRLTAESGSPRVRLDPRSNARGWVAVVEATG